MDTTREQENVQAVEFQRAELMLYGALSRQSRAADGQFFVEARALARYAVSVYCDKASRAARGLFEPVRVRVAHAYIIYAGAHGSTVLDIQPQGVLVDAPQALQVWSRNEAAAALREARAEGFKVERVHHYRRF